MRFDPAEAEERRLAAADARCFDVNTRQVSFDGTVQVVGELDLADALDLDDAITHRAQELKDLGCEESLTYAGRWPPATSPATKAPWSSRPPPVRSR